MKTLTIKVLVLLTPILSLFLGVLSATGNSEKLRAGVFDKYLEAKMHALIKDDTRIVIAGDSRAERQLVPAIIEERTGLKTANVARASCDLITLYNALKSHDLLGKKYVLIVSASFFQVNDGAIDRGYVSTACTVNMTLKEKLFVYRNSLRSLWLDMVEVAFGKKSGDAGGIDDSRLRNQGFLGVEGAIKQPLTVVLDPERTDHPWYKNISIRGARWRIFRETLAKLERTGYRIYIYQSPVSPVWYRYTKGTFIDRSETAYSEMLRSLLAGHRDAGFLDYYGEPAPGLGDDMYYDIQHLNRTGATAFTNRMMDRIGGDIRRWVQRSGQSGGANSADVISVRRVVER